MINHPNRSKKTKNTLFPGRPNYTGPTTGIFGMLHHEVLVESSHDVMERVTYVRERKPENEIAIRLHNMIYLGDCPAAVDYDAKCDALYTDHKAKCASLDDDYRVKCASLDADRLAKCASLDADCKADILIYIRSHIPDCAWNGKTLVFDGSAAQCGN